MEGCHVLISEIKGYITVVEIVVSKVLLDNLLLVACADHEIIEAVIGILLHYMPEYGLAAYLYHGLWL